MIVRALAVAAALVTAALLETALFPWLTVLGFRPDLVVLVVVVIALRDGPLAGARVGAVAGLLVDLLVSQPPLGLSVLVYVVLGYAAGIVRPYLAPESVTAPILVSFVAGFLATGTYGILASVLGAERFTSVLLLQASLTVGAYTAILAPVALWAIGRLTERFPLQGHARE